MFASLLTETGASKKILRELNISLPRDTDVCIVFVFALPKTSTGAGRELTHEHRKGANSRT